MDIIESDIDRLYNQWLIEEELNRLYAEQQKLALILFIFQLTLVYMYYYNLYYNFNVLFIKLESKKFINKKSTP
jgi:hypothetical protein